MEGAARAQSQGYRLTSEMPVARALLSAARHRRRQDSQLAAVCESCANGRHLGAPEPSRDHREWVSDDSSARGENPVQDGDKALSRVGDLSHAEFSEIGSKTPSISMVFKDWMHRAMDRIPRL